MDTIGQQLNKKPGSLVAFCTTAQEHAGLYQSRLFAKARPEPDFRYFSNRIALSSSVKEREVISFQGRNLAVWGDWPALWDASLFSRSEVEPI